MHRRAGFRQAAIRQQFAFILMCGIAGFIGEWDAARLDDLTDALAHRGPDGRGVDFMPSGSAIGLPASAVGLGHRRLSIIDVAGGAQPMWNADRTVGLVFNGEIYNFRQLRKELEACGQHFSTHSDTEVILHGWRVWGPRVVDRLEGMFAFAVWDTRARSLFLVRDRHGIKPLYYSIPRPGQIIFASEIRPLLRAAETAVTINRSALYEYLLRGWSAQESTLFSGVQQLQPGCLMRFDPTKGASAARVERYWRMQRPGTAELAASASNDEVADTLCTLFDKAVSAHLVADVEVGVLLSGGLDSSAVAASMARLMDPSSIQAFTIGFGLPDDEIPFARSAASHCGIKSKERLVHPSVFSSEFTDCIESLEEPIAHPVMQTTWQAAKFVRQNVKVALLGEGSDELFAGYPHYRLLRPPFSLLPGRLVRKYALDVMCLMPDSRTLGRLMTPGSYEPDALGAIERRIQPWFGGDDDANDMLRFEAETALVQNQLMRVDKLTMAHSVEARVPFLDNTFAEYANALPFALKTENGTAKAIFRKAMQSRLPTDVLYRPKSGKKGTQALLPMINGLLASGGPLHHLVDEKSIAARGWFDPKATRGWIDGMTSPVVRHHPIESRRRAKFALALAVLEQWCRLYLDVDRRTSPVETKQIPEPSRCPP
ncbi:asparagine synthase (glutamine-hydrolyzing) [Bradyrhizobium sp. CB1015]|uniref:asparagine synthase (glutamine-hydrolyzing) n=1 Tax=Bradyrhizobium sp. CB1015 TaxID=2976822 RepID=UPI0021AA5CC4|nr:asparagine synthase (glutamine-hydrolyzing) [Bradyrhizobium sp. CB1015]UWU90629.1 asparagine synthase (glutamine-hydrolyzing) [Bradyrhizobium sp. CB1015]